MRVLKMAAFCGCGLGQCAQVGVERHDDAALADSIVTIFSAAGRPVPAEVRLLAKDMQDLVKRRPDLGADLLSPEAVREWFNDVYWRSGSERLGGSMADAMKISKLSGTSFPFRACAEQFRMVESPMVPVIIPRDDEAKDWVKKLELPQIPSGTIARAVQAHIVQIPARARSLLVAGGHAAFRNPELRGDQFCVLESSSLYRDDSGLWWENAEYLATEIGII